MSQQNKTKKSKTAEVAEYPIIYSYIYEREMQDIKRLSDKMKPIKNRKISASQSSKTILEYKVVNGKVVPVYEENKKK